MTTPVHGPVETVGQRVKELRTRNGLTATQLGEQLTDMNIKWDRFTVASLESGKRQNVTVTELLALAVALNVSPLHLLVPTLPAALAAEDGGSRPTDDPNDPSDEALYQVTPKQLVPVWRVRQFIRGLRPLPGMDPWKFYAEQPLHERPSEDSLRGLVESNERYKGGA